MKNFIILSTIAVLTLALLQPAAAFTPTGNRYYSNMHTNNPISTSWNQNSGLINNAISSIKQDVTKARVFVRDTVQRTKDAGQHVQDRYTITRDISVPVVKREYETEKTKVTNEVTQIRDYYVDNKDTYFSRVKQAVKINLEDNKQEIKKRMQKYVPRTQQILQDIEFNIRGLFNRNGF